MCALYVQRPPEAQAQRLSMGRDAVYATPSWPVAPVTHDHVNPHRGDRCPGQWTVHGDGRAHGDDALDVHGKFGLVKRLYQTRGAWPREKLYRLD